MPPSQTESSNLSRIASKSVASRPLGLTAKAARKLMSEQSQSDSSDSRPATASSQNDGESNFDDSDSDVFQVRLDHDVRRHSARPTLVAKRTRKVKFDIQDDSDSDDATVRAEPSPRRVRQNLPAQSEQSPQIVNQMKKSGIRKTQKSRGSALKQSDIANDKPFKSTRDHDFRRVEISKWGGNFAQKERRESGRHYARMSIGSSSQRRTSQGSSISKQDKRRRWFLRRGNVGSRGRRSSANHEAGSGRYNEDLHQPLKQTASKAARKFQVGSKSTAPRPPAPLHEWHDEGEHDIDSDAVGDEYRTDTSENDDYEGKVLDHTEPSQTLLDRLEGLSLSVVRLHKMRRLPFLRRNLRSGFQLHCRMVGVDTKPYSVPRTPISVVYTFPLTDGATAHSGGFRTTSAKSSMKNWLCPLCDLHNKIDNPRMLEKHLAWDHSSVKVLWDEHRTMLSLTIPDSQPESNPVITRRQAPIRDLSISEFSSDSRHVGRSMKSTEADEKSLVRISSTPSGLASESGSGSVSTIPTTVEEDLKPKYVMPGTSSHAVANPSIRSNLVSGRLASQTLSGADAQDGLGPSATPPYVPETDGRGDVYYSCRPGGPRLFDFLNTLSLKPYGVLKWVIIDREEELFELDDILDEDKVMQALWFRWIFLNRNKFVANYFDGTKVFINQNWRLIKQGAGLLALRTWLLVLLVNNFLLPTEVATLMRYYQELANIQLRY